jgi:hypothetical protein
MKKALLILIVVSIALPAAAKNNNWTGAVNSNWATGDNWSRGHAPRMFGDVPKKVSC